MWYSDVLSILWIFIAYFSWWVIPIFLLILGKVKWNRFPIEAIIVEKRGDNIIKVNDRIGRRYEKASGHTHYLLQKMGDVIDVLPFDTVLHCNYVPTNIFEWLVNKIRPTAGTVHLLKYGSKQYKPIKIEKGKTLEGTMFETIKDAEGKDMLVERVLPFDIRNYLGALNFQLIDWDDVNTTLNEIENSRMRRLAKYDSWAKFTIPIAMIAVVGVICIIILYLTYDAQLQFCENAPAPEPDKIIEAPLGGGGSGGNIIPSITQIS